MDMVVVVGVAIVEVVIVDVVFVDKVLVVDIPSVVRVAMKMQNGLTCPVQSTFGPSVPLGDPTTFLALFTPELLDHIMKKTNAYAEQCISATNQGDGPPPT